MERIFWCRNNTLQTCNLAKHPLMARRQSKKAHLLLFFKDVTWSQAGVLLFLHSQKVDLRTIKLEVLKSPCQLLVLRAAVALCRLGRTLRGFCPEIRSDISPCTAPLLQGTAVSWYLSRHYNPGAKTTESSDGKSLIPWLLNSPV